jgi:hypothetical protein
LLLLSKFLKGDSPTSYDNAGYWEAVLKEKPAKVIQQFVVDEMLEPADLRERVDYRYRAVDLKPFLKERGLKVSGRKEELIQRLIDHDSSGMVDATHGVNLYRCTGEGARLAQNYLEGEKEKRRIVEQQVLGLLKQEEFSRAIRVVEQYEATQVFQRGLGIDWNNVNGSSDIKSLNAIFHRKPAILKRAEEDRLSQLRVAAGMTLLWGTNDARRWLPENLDTGIHLDGETACRMLVFHAWHLRDMKGYKEAGALNVEVNAVGDSLTCSECEEIGGKKYPIAKVPQLPYGKCTSELGCRCSTIVGEFA